MFWFNCTQCCIEFITFKSPSLLITKHLPNCQEASAIIPFSCSVVWVLALIVDPCSLPTLLLGMSAIKLIVVLSTNNSVDIVLVTVLFEAIFLVSIDIGRVRLSWRMIVGNNLFGNCASTSILFLAACFSWSRVTRNFTYCLRILGKIPYVHPHASHRFTKSQAASMMTTFFAFFCAALVPGLVDNTVVSSCAAAAHVGMT